MIIMETGNPRPGSNYITAIMLGRPDSTPQAKVRQETCLWCGKELTGPSYKKFCDSKHHDAYNNKKKAEKWAEMKKLNGPMEQNDKFLAKLHAKNEKEDWPITMLDYPDFNRKARCSIVIDDRLELKGKKYIHYSVHPNNNNNTFRILYHEHCDL